MADYANLFRIETQASVAGGPPDLVRLIFIDERPAIAEGLPKSSTEVANLVMMPSNATALRDLLNRMLPK